MRIPRPEIPVGSLVDGVLQFLGVIKNAPVDTTDSLVFGRVRLWIPPISLPNQSPPISGRFIHHSGTTQLLARSSLVGAKWGNVER